MQKLSKLASEIWNEYWTLILTQAQIDYMVNKFQSFEAIKKQIENDEYIYNIIEHNGNQVGYFGVTPKTDYLFLSKFYIKKDFRGIGCGNFAFNKIMQIARQYNKKAIKLTVNKYNTNTIKIYEKWGFKTVEAVVTDIGNNFVMDDYIMKYELQK